MKIMRTTTELRKELNNKYDQIIGLVPTMGALHEGHLSLVRKAKEACDIVVVSIFVNPTQFAPNEDLDSYPRDLQRDSQLLEAEGVDFIFAPSVEEIYPDEALTFVKVDKISEKLCGGSRPAHFQGVGTVVCKLFNIVNPDKAYFGQKDYQQALVIKKLVQDLNFPIEIVMCPIVRETDGLAMSSRNQYLSEIEREEAPALFRSLKLAQKLVKEGEHDVENLKAIIWSYIEDNTSGKIDYVEILDATDLSDIEKIDRPVVIALAVKFGQARLIDNVVIAIL